jgi:predicted Zn-dependent protease
MAALGMGADVGVMLPFSRTHESEADHIGLILMAKAGYDPREGPKLWERMGQMSSGAPPELLSTHPAASTRIADMNKVMPEMVKIYEESKGGAAPKAGAPKEAVPKAAAPAGNVKAGAAPSEGQTPVKPKKPAVPSGGGI